MSSIEHYFENLLFYGEDRTMIGNDVNKNQLTVEVQDAIKECSYYVIYTLFGNRERFIEYINKN